MITGEHLRRQSVHEELKNGFEKWLRGLPVAKQDPETTPSVNRINGSARVDEHGMNSEQYDRK